MAHRQGFYEKYIKRPQDFVLATAATVVLSPVMLATGLLVKKKLGTPVIFSQERPGLNGKIFKLHKFRSMTDEKDEQGNLLPDDVRLTSFGKKLRSTSLDELPELFNIIKGDMSIVGPRPLLVRYLERYNTHQARRHEVRPGFTGLAQVHGRNAISWEEKFDWDVKYVDHVSFLGDWKIIFDTVKTVLKHEGISSGTTATMEEFMGSEEKTIKPRILILANDAGGLLCFRKELLEELVSRDYEVYCCLPEDSLVQDVEKIGCTIVPCSLLQRHGMNPVKDLQLLLFYKKLVGTINPDIVFTYTIKPNVYGGIACAINNIPYVSNITGLGTAVENGGPLQTVTLMLYKFGLRKAQKVFFQNASNLRFMLDKRIIHCQFDLLPGSGVNLEKFSLKEYPQGQTVNFVFVARIIKEKGIDEYLEAAEKIHPKYPETQFHVFGPCEQDYQEKLQFMQEQNLIIYHGYARDMPKVYELASCTVLPTYYPEGLNNVLLESAASGRPIITTDRSGCREVVEDGVTGYIVKQKNSQDLIEKIDKFLGLSVDERRAMGLAGRAKVEREFDRQIVIQKYMYEVERVAK